MIDSDKDFFGGNTMKMKCLRIRQLLSIVLCLAMLFANVPTVFAEGTVTLSSPVTVNKGNLSTYQNAVLTTNGTAKPEDSLLVYTLFTTQPSSFARWPSSAPMALFSAGAAATF